MIVRSHDTDIYYESEGDGEAVILLHPFPLHCRFWSGVSPALRGRYRVLMPDLRGHGRSGIGYGAATMSKHVDDLLAVMKDAGIERAHFCGDSIGGYILFEFWRRERHRVRSLALCCTRATADSEEARANRRRNIDHVREFGTARMFDSMAKQHVSAETIERRPDIVRAAREMMDAMSVEAFISIQQGMMQRPDSAETCKTIDVPTVVVAGSDDRIASVAEHQQMQRLIHKSRLEMVPGAGHYAPMEMPQVVGPMLRQFFDASSR